MPQSDVSVLTVSEVHDGRRQRAEVGVLQGVLCRDPLSRDPPQHPLDQVLRLIGQLVQPDPHGHRWTHEGLQEASGTGPAYSASSVLFPIDSVP